jgi:sugar lactone lactonase YvrE
MIVMTLLIVAAGISTPRSLTVSASGRAHEQAGNKVCKTVVKRVHGKKKRVKVCRTVKPKPAAAPTPTPEPSNFAFLWGSAVDGQGSVFVADRGAKQVVKLSPNGQILARWPVPPDPSVPGSPELFGVAVDRQGNVYVPDSRADRIVKLSPTGVVLAAWDTPDKETSDWSFGTTGIALDVQGDIYTTDWQHSHVEKFAPSGTLLASFGKECPQLDGSTACASQDHNPPLPIPPGQLNHPVGVALDARGNMYINDHRSNRIVKYSPTGQQLAIFGPDLPAPYPSLDLPEGVGVDGAGNILIADPSVRLFVKLSPSGAPLGQWEAPSGYWVVGTPGVDARGNLYVTIGSALSGHASMIVKLSPGLQPLEEWK